MKKINLLSPCIGSLTWFAVSMSAALSGLLVWLCVNNLKPKHTIGVRRSTVRSSESRAERWEVSMETHWDWSPQRGGTPSFLSLDGTDVWFDQCRLFILSFLCPVYYLSMISIIFRQCLLHYSFAQRFMCEEGSDNTSHHLPNFTMMAQEYQSHHVGLSIYPSGNMTHCVENNIMQSVRARKKPELHPCMHAHINTHTGNLWQLLTVCCFYRDAQEELGQFVI